MKVSCRMEGGFKAGVVIIWCVCVIVCVFSYVFNCILIAAKLMSLFLYVFMFLHISDKSFLTYRHKIGKPARPVS